MRQPSFTLFESFLQQFFCRSPGRTQCNGRILTLLLLGGWASAVLFSPLRWTCNGASRHPAVQEFVVTTAARMTFAPWSQRWWGRAPTGTRRPHVYGMGSYVAASGKLAKTRRSEPMVLRASEKSWDLRGAPEGAVLSLARAFEAEWMQAGPNLRTAPCAPEFKTIDAGEEGSHIRIENLCLQTDIFRKMHLEVAWGMNGLEVLHVVMYPWARFGPLPIFAADMVAFRGRASLCIADVAPATDALVLPPEYESVVAPLRARLEGIELRPLPDWGTRILSPACVCLGPRGEEAAAQTVAFDEYARGLLRTHLDLAADAKAVGPKEVAEALGAQRRFCEQQLRNAKTRRVLESAMGAEMAARYMEEVLFDVTSETAVEP